MSPVRKKPASALPAVTALLVFLAKHLEIAELPLDWDVRRDPDGGRHDLWVDAEHRTPNSGELFAAVGKALRAQVDVNEFVSSAGEATTHYHLSGSTGGVSVTGDAFVPTALLGGVE